MMSRFHRAIFTACLSVGAIGPCLGDYEAGIRAWERRDFETAIAEFRHSADAGEQAAQDHLGMMYEDGEGVPASDQTAAYWYQQAAEQGYAPAQLNLGRMYRNGKGVPQNDVQAVSWYRKAAVQGLSVAQFFLGLMYDTGKGVDEDAVQAYMWFSLAAQQGDRDAAFKRDRVVDRLSAAQRAAADQAAMKYASNVPNPTSASSTSPATVPNAPVPNAPVPNATVPDVTVPDVTAPNVATNSTSGTTVSVTTAPTEAVTEAEVHRMQTYLNELGFDVGRPDGTAGERTQRAVRAFQSSVGIAVDGVLSRDLVAALENERTARATASGAPTDPGARVLAVQRELGRLGYDPGSVDGAMGSKTRAAIGAFQRSIGMPETGEPTTELLDTLRATRIEIIDAEPSSPTAATGTAQGEAPASARSTEASNVSGPELIRAIQQQLRARGFDPGPADGAAGTRTVNAAREFQRAVGLSVDGELTGALLARLEQKEIEPSAASSANPTDATTVVGDPTVFSVQVLLTRLGYDLGTPDGAVGRRTVQAAQAFQREMGEGATGDIGVGLLRELEKAEARGFVAEATIKGIQRDLTRLGYTPGTIDGRGGPSTASAIRAFQRDAGLDISGKTSVDLARRLEVLAGQ